MSGYRENNINKVFWNLLNYILCLLHFFGGGGVIYVKNLMQMYAFWQYCCKYWQTKQIGQRDTAELHYIILGII